MATTKRIEGAARGVKSSAKTALAITVLSGGPSGEREVSLESGQCVADALKLAGHQVYIEDINPDNLGALARQVDVVFVALHGAFGEDGGVQTILERRGLHYTGSEPAACALAMNKPAAKARFAEAGLPTPRWTVATRTNLREALSCWSLPLVAKPTKEGSSLFCHIIRTFDELRPAVEAVIENYGECLIEEFISGLELTVGILADKALPPIEIRTPRSFYDYEAKYRDERTEYRFDIDLPAALLKQIQEQSLAAHRLLGCRDFSRVDWRVDPARSAGYILEVNTVPGLTTHSLLPKAAAKNGIEMTQLCDDLVGAAYRRKV